MTFKVFGFYKFVKIKSLKKNKGILQKFLLVNDYEPFWVSTMFYNPDNFFINDNNYYKNVATFNTLAIPNEKTFFVDKERFTEIVDEYTQPLNVLTKIIK